jgi:transcriptional regulator with XRE-family HTH domain
MIAYFKLRLKHYRLTNGMSQEELAKKSGLSQQYISVIESINRQESPTLTSIIKLSQALKICPYALLQYECDKNCKKHNNCTLEQTIQDINYTPIDYEI